MRKGSGISKGLGSCLAGDGNRLFRSTGGSAQRAWTDRQHPYWRGAVDSLVSPEEWNLTEWSFG